MMNRSHPDHWQTNLLKHPPAARQFPYRLAMRFYGPQQIRATRAQYDSFVRLKEQADPLADNLVTRIHQDGGEVWRMFNQALEEGIGTVPHPPAELIALFDEVDKMPFWLNHERLDSAASAIAMVGREALPIFIAGLALSYVAPDANEVLLRSGDLHTKAGKRAVETLAWYNQVTAPGGLARFGEGFKACVRIRMIHAHMRRAMNNRPDWDHEKLGNPIHQSIYCATLIPFAVMSGMGALALGHVPFARRRSQVRSDVFHMWRYIATLVGVHPDLVPADEGDMWRLVWLQLYDTFQPCDTTATLGGALFNALPEILGVDVATPEGRERMKGVEALYGTLTHLMLGKQLATALTFPRSVRGALLIARIFVKNALLHAATSVVPGGTSLWRRRQMRQHRTMMGAIIERTHADLSFTRG